MLDCGSAACCYKCQVVQGACKGVHHISSGRGHDVVGRSGKWFICSLGALAVDATGVHSQVGLLPLGLGLHVCITASPLVGLFLVVPRLKHGDNGVHGQLNIQDGELCSLCLLLGFFHGQDEVWHPGSVS